MRDDTYEFTTESEPGEQAYESAVASTKAFAAKSLDTDEAPAHRADDADTVESIALKRGGEENGG